ncbi:MAG: NAD-dependent deacylase, partial [Bacteroidetes bacterium]
MKKRIVVLTGAGISAESGLKTFRGAGGLWEGHAVTDVATPEAFARNPELVLRFYNQRRAQLREVEPNEGHRALKRLEEKYEVHIITQNVDDLHERAGSSNILHLHGMLRQARSVKNEHLIVEVEGDIQLGDLAEDGGQLRPHIVWFGEPVPNIVPAARLASRADLFIIIGTSLLVYPAAGLLDYVPLHVPVYVVDPNSPDVFSGHQITMIAENASLGVPMLVDK